jgi:serine/threonine protein kinase
VIGRTVSHYRILSPLGAGGMGVVYLAEDTRLGRQVALKFLPATWSQDTKALDRFRVEARAASSLSHPSICAIFDIGQDGDTPFIVMEALKGTTLRDRILKGPLKVADVLEIGMQLADALEAAHAQGIVHRDIKPANIFLGERNRVKVLDFGLAKLTGPGSAPSGATDTTSSNDRAKSNQMTQPGTALGTVSYMSPEQARGEPVDSRTDLFSLGAVLYEMVTGVQAFGGSTTAVVYDAILNRAPRPISSLNPLIPARLETVIATALEKDRDLRYQHASDLQAELKRIRRDLDTQSLAGSQTVVVPSRQSAPTAPVAAGAADTASVPPRAGANWPARIAILLASLVVAAAAVLFFRGQPPGERAAAPASDAPAISSAEPAGTTVSPPPPAATTPAPVPERQAAPAPPAPTPQPRPRATAPSETPPDPRAPLPSPTVTPAKPAQTAGVEAAPSPPPSATPSPALPPPVVPAAPEEVKQQLPRTAPAEQTAASPVPAPAQAAPPPPRPATPEPAPPAAAPVETDDAAIRRVIRVYEQAIEAKDIALYRSVRTNLTRAAETVLMNSFRQIDSQEIDIKIESLRIDGRTASARLVRRDTLVTGGRREVRNSTQTMRFEKTDAGWLIAE